MFYLFFRVKIDDPDGTVFGLLPSIRVYTYAYHNSYHCASLIINYYSIIILYYYVQVIQYSIRREYQDSEHNILYGPSLLTSLFTYKFENVSLKLLNLKLKYYISYRSIA